MNVVILNLEPGHSVISNIEPVCERMYYQQAMRMFSAHRTHLNQTYGTVLFDSTEFLAFSTRALLGSFDVGIVRLLGVMLHHWNYG